MSSVFTYRCPEHGIRTREVVSNVDYHVKLHDTQWWPYCACQRRMVLVKVADNGKHFTPEER